MNNPVKALAKADHKVAEASALYLTLRKALGEGLADLFLEEGEDFAPDRFIPLRQEVCRQAKRMNDLEGLAADIWASIPSPGDAK